MKEPEKIIPGNAEVLYYDLCIGKNNKTLFLMKKRGYIRDRNLQNDKHIAY